MRLPVYILAASLVFATGAHAAKKPKTEASAREGLKEPAVRSLIRLAPDFNFPGPGNRSRTLRSFRGQPVILLIAASPRTGAYRKQLSRLEEIYSEFASRGAIFVAAFVNEGDGPVKSNVPFAIANNGPAVASAYGVSDDFNIAIIGKDGNVDYQTPKVLPASRIRDVIQNSYLVQKESRR